MSSVLLDDISDLYLNSFCFGYRLHDFNTLLPSFAGYYFRSENFRSILNKLAQGSTRFNLSKNELMKEKISIPSLEEQNKIVHILRLADKEIEFLKADLSQQKILKKSLMQLLLTGLVRVKV